MGTHYHAQPNSPFAVQFLQWFIENLNPVVRSCDINMEQQIEDISSAFTFSGYHQYRRSGPKEVTVHLELFAYWPEGVEFTYEEWARQVVEALPPSPKALP